MSNLSYIYSPETETFTFVVNGKSYNVARGSHKNYEKIKQALVDRKLDQIEALVDTSKSLITWADGNVEVRNGNVFYKGQEVHNTVCDRILALMEEGLPFEPMVKFYENLMLNPSKNSVDQLYKFLEHKALPITEDGCFLGYKGVRADFYDRYSGTINNSVGSTPQVERNTVDDNPDHHCSHGLHVGSLEYAKGYAGGDGVLIIVKVNPADCVSVPKDCNFQKLRTHKYEVIAIHERDLDESPLYRSDAKPMYRDDFAYEDDLDLDVDYDDECTDEDCDYEECENYYNKRDSHGRFTKK